MQVQNHVKQSEPHVLDRTVLICYSVLL